ncbi:hypothetical protein BZA77DRAFT_139036 [Pyronema omphalodes]|nr:hypothetical protein BZA77DRAFT_139036 [Pyronema omphalodes]
MSNSNDNNQAFHPRDRRASLMPGTSLSDFLSSSRQPTTTSAYPGPITTAAAHANQRRMSMSSASGSPPQISTSFRRGSVSSVSSTSSQQDESAIDDTEPTSGTSPSSPFARRMSWGARALRDVRIPTARVPPSPGASGSPTVARGFWPESKSSYSTDSAFQQRRQSMPPPPATAMPAPKDKPTDYVQERILRNELYMD